MPKRKRCAFEVGSIYHKDALASLPVTKRGYELAVQLAQREAKKFARLHPDVKHTAQAFVSLRCGKKTDTNKGASSIFLLECTPSGCSRRHLWRPAPIKNPWMNVRLAGR